MAGPSVTEDVPALVRRGVAWSAVSSLVLRAGNLVVGIVVARLLTPEDFGVFAVALTVQSVLVTLADLGMSADLVRSSDPARRAPTVATLSLLSSGILAVLMIVTAGPVAASLGSADAAPAVVVLACCLLISGAGVVPYAALQRDFRQSTLFATDSANFVVSTVLTIVLVLLGLGPMALAWSRLGGQLVTTGLQFVFARMRPRFGFARDVAGSALAFGAPLALANMLSWALLSVDNVIVARGSGAVALGFYVLAFNVSSWPMSAIGQVVRGVTLAALARERGDGSQALGRAVALTGAAATLAGLLLAVLAVPVVGALYGATWDQSAAALPGLAVFGGIRVVLDVLATHLIARGHSRAVLWVQVWWIVTLVPAMVLGIRWGGLAGAGWAHVVVAVVLVAPAYLVAVQRTGTPLRPAAAGLVRPLLAAVPAGLVAALAAAAFESPWWALLAGGSAGALVYAALLVRWVRGLVSTSADEAAALPVEVQAEVVARTVADGGPPPASMPVTGIGPARPVPPRT